MSTGRGVCLVYGQLQNVFVYIVSPVVRMIMPLEPLARERTSNGMAMTFGAPSNHFPLTFEIDNLQHLIKQKYLSNAT